MRIVKLLLSTLPVIPMTAGPPAIGVEPRFGSAVTSAGRVPVGTLGSCTLGFTFVMTCVHAPAEAAQLVVLPATWIPALDVNVALIAPAFPFVESNQPANSNELVRPAVNGMPVLGIIAGTVLLPAVAPEVPKPMTIWPAELLIA